MLSTGTITIEYNGVENFTQGTNLHIKIIVVNPFGNTIDTQFQTLTIREEQNTVQYKAAYDFKIYSLAKRLVAQWGAVSGYIYNVQFSGL